MALKNARLARAENLTDAERKTLGIDSGLVIIESRNPELKENLVPIGDGGSINRYLKSLGKFVDVDIDT